MAVGAKVRVYGDWDGSAIKQAESDLEKFGKSASKIGGNLTKFVTLPLVGVGAAATAMSIEFESSMAKIVGLVGIASDEVAGMQESVLSLAGRTAKSPKELADALFVVTSAGLRGADAMDALELSAKAGAAGLGETNDIARAVAGAMNAYGSSVVDAAKATDVIVATARAGNFETSQFSAALGRVLPFAKQAGASLEDMGGAVALLTRTNGDAAQSVTQVQALFRAFVVPTEEAKKAFAGVGLSAADMRKAIAEDGLPAALTMLDKKLGGNREQLGRLLGSSEAASAAFQILDADAETLAGTFGVVNDAAGMTGEAFDVVAETSGFKLQQSFIALKASLIAFGDIIAPFVEKFAGALTALVAAFDNLSPQTREFIVIGAAIAAALGPVILIVGKLVTAIAAIVAVANPVSAAIVGIIAAVALLAAGFAYLWNNSEQLRDTVAQVFATIKAVIGQVMTEVQRVIDENRTTIEQLKVGFQAFVDFLMAYVVPILVTFYGTYLSTLIKVLGIIITTVVQMIGAFIQFVAKLIEVGTFLVEWTASTLETITGWVTAISTGLTTAFTTVKEFIAGVFESIYDTIVNTIKSAVNFVIRGINRVINAWNGLSFTIPTVEVPFVGTFGGQSVGVAQLPGIPELAEGGIVTRPTLALVGEAGPEAVIPLSRAGGVSGTTINLTVNAGMGTDGAEVGRQIVDALRQYQRRNGPVPISVA